MRGNPVYRGNNEGYRDNNTGFRGNNPAGGEAAQETSFLRVPGSRGMLIFAYSIKSTTYHEKNSFNLVANPLPVFAGFLRRFPGNAG